MSNVHDILGLSSRGAAMQTAAKPAPPMDVRSIRLDMIEPDPEQPRRTFDDETLDELAESLRRDGLLQPIRVRPNPARPGCFLIIAGERRWRAAQRAGLRELAAIVVEHRETDARFRVEQVVENLQREEVNAVEEGDSYRTLLRAWGCSQAELARRVSKSTAHVSKMVAVAELDEETRRRIVRGEVSYTDALRARDRQLAKATSTPARRRRTPAAKRGTVTVPAGVVKIKRGKTLAELVEQLRELVDQERRDAA